MKWLLELCKKWRPLELFYYKFSKTSLLKCYIYYGEGNSWVNQIIALGKTGGILFLVLNAVGIHLPTRFYFLMGALYVSLVGILGYHLLHYAKLRQTLQKLLREFNPDFQDIMHEIKKKND